MAKGAGGMLVIGATSAIAEAVARRFATRGHALFLAGRNADRLKAVADDLRVRGARAVHTGILDVDEIGAHQSFIDEAARTLGALDLVLIAHGTLPNQTECQTSPAKTLEAVGTNFLSTISLLTILVDKLERQGFGSIAVITSVAGDRGRASNYVYGAAKAGVSTFLAGVRHRLHERGIRVIDVRPGFVDTPMTAAFAKGALWASATRVAYDIERAIDRGTAVIYTPWFWRWIMLVIRLLPYRFFHRLRF